jgi:hypothetical protein
MRLILRRVIAGWLCDFGRKAGSGVYSSTRFDPRQWRSDDGIECRLGHGDRPFSLLSVGGLIPAALA